MKNLHLLLLAIITLSIFTACEEEGLDQGIHVNPYLMYFAGLGTPTAPFEGASPMAEVDVYFFDSKEDYLFDENPILVVEDFSGGAINDEVLNQTVWMRVRKDNLLNDRNTGLATYKPADSIPLCPCGGNGKRGGYVFLSRPQTSLQVQVFNEGEPVEGAWVYLYISRDAFDNRFNPNFTPPEFVSYAAGDHNSITYLRNNNSTGGGTNSEGIVTFDNLEDREYWIRVGKPETLFDDALTNEGTTIKTNGPLKPDGITTILQIGIN